MKTLNLKSVLLGLTITLLLMGISLPIHAQDLIKDTKNGVAKQAKERVQPNKIYEKILEVKTAKAFETLKPLTVAKNSKALLTEKKAYVKDAIFYNANTEKFNYLYEEKPSSILLQLPVSEKNTIELELIKANYISDNFVMETSDGQIFDQTKNMGTFYKGVVKGDPNSVVSVNIFDDEIKGIIADKDGNYILGTLKGEKDVMVLYSEKDLLTDTQLTPAEDYVGIPEGKESLKNNINNSFKSAANSSSDFCVEIDIECDYTVYKHFGNDQDAVLDYVTNLFCETALIFELEDINIRLVDVYVWTQDNSPYKNIINNCDNGAPDGNGGYQNCAYEMLAKFAQQTQNNHSGRLAHLFFVERLFGGGYAYLDVLDENYTAYNNGQFRGPYAVTNICNSDVCNSNPSFPTYDPALQTFAHELGHNLGSPHTHECAWGPNNNTALDNCAAPEGGCACGPAPVGGGTIMSYCNSGEKPCGGNTGTQVATLYGINLNNGFGNEPGDLIRSRVEAAGAAGIIPECTSCEDVFDNYSWLNTNLNPAVNPNNCTSEIITVYKKGVHYYIHVQTPTTSKLYYNGSLWCTDYGNFSCVNWYGLTNVVDMWYCGCSSMGRMASEGQAITLYPNPTDGLLNVNLNEEQDKTSVLVSIYSVDGKEVYLNQHDVDGILTLDVNHLSDYNFYYIKIQTKNGQVYTNKFLKQ